MNEMLILTAVVIVICIILNKISNRLGNSNAFRLYSIGYGFWF